MQLEVKTILNRIRSQRNALGQSPPECVAPPVVSVTKSPTDYNWTPVFRRIRPHGAGINAITLALGFGQRILDETLEYLRVGESLSSVCFCADGEVWRGARVVRHLRSERVCSCAHGLYGARAVEDLADVRRLLPGSTSTHRRRAAVW